MNKDEIALTEARHLNEKINIELKLKRKESSVYQIKELLEENPTLKKKVEYEKFIEAGPKRRLGLNYLQYDIRKSQNNESSSDLIN